ncbi:hypothetical protein [Streptomyces sp. ISL-86]|nr:hypothetical protein [Streptomyces sp. ISL-86]MBT2456625.1 hypothetical protein [Streptomyces sp. ISL-86]
MSPSRSTTGPPRMLPPNWMKVATATRTPATRMSRPTAPTMSTPMNGVTM